jgi:G3E family GTPase
MAPISVTVFTGFLGIRQNRDFIRTQRSPAFIIGAGKTSLILKCLPQFPQDYKVVLLKNEFGDVQGETHAWQHRLELTRGIVAIFSR